MVSYCLGITHVEPLGAGLLFERFLNPERTDPPDIDLDFPWDERDAVLGYVFGHYPHPQSAMVANHNTFRLRGALREVAKVHGRPNGEIREVTRRIPWYDEEPLEQLLASHPNFRELDLPAGWRDLARQAEPLVGIPRHLSVHPGGVVIVPTALTDYVPTEPAVKTLDGYPDLTVPVIQFEKDGAEDAGLVKIDLLGNRSLAVIRDAIAAVHAHTGRLIDYTSATRETTRPPGRSSAPAGRWASSTPSRPPPGCSAPRAGPTPSSCWCSTPASSGPPPIATSAPTWSGSMARPTSPSIPCCATPSPTPSA